MQWRNIRVTEPSGWSYTSCDLFGRSCRIMITQADGGYFASFDFGGYESLDKAQASMEREVNRLQKWINGYRAHEEGSQWSKRVRAFLKRAQALEKEY